MKAGQLARDYDENQYTREFSDKECEVANFYFATLGYEGAFLNAQTEQERAEKLYHYYQDKACTFKAMADNAENVSDKKRFERKSKKAFDFSFESQHFFH